MCPGTLCVAEQSECADKWSALESLTALEFSAEKRMSPRNLRQFSRTSAHAPGLSCDAIFCACCFTSCSGSIPNALKSLLIYSYVVVVHQIFHSLLYPRSSENTASYFIKAIYNYGVRILPCRTCKGLDHAIFSWRYVGICITYCWQHRTTPSVRSFLKKSQILKCCYAATLSVR